MRKEARRGGTSNQKSHSEHRRQCLKLPSDSVRPVKASTVFQLSLPYLTNGKRNLTLPLDSSLTALEFTSVPSRVQQPSSNPVSDEWLLDSPGWQV